MWAGRKRWM